jgi:hypothetical protein
MGILLSSVLITVPSAIWADEEPELPAGLDDTGKEVEPELPFGLSQEEEALEKYTTTPDSFYFPFDLNGFWEIREGTRTQNDPYQKDSSLGETRLQLEMQKNIKNYLITIISDFIYDHVYDHHTVHLEEGDGFIDLREINILFEPLEFMDIKLGRQILTWGTGDMLFLNDLFPKDWKSFFIGRDVEYLKAPSDTLKMGLFTKVIDIDIVYTPRFDPDRFIEGKRISYWNNSIGRLAGRDKEVAVIKPDEWFDDSEVALRFSRNIKGYELSVYYYYGFWKSPEGLDLTTGKAIFPDLSVYGASIRGNCYNGIGNLEFAYYSSLDDQNGNNPFIKNSEFRSLIGYEQEIAHDFTLGFQYYLEYMMDYHAYVRTFPNSSIKVDKDRHVITLRLTKVLMNQNLTLSIFSYYSPSDQDAYLRPRIHYKIDDHWSVEAGGNIFFGEEEYTFFGQLENNSNLYMGLRYSF